MVVTYPGNTKNTAPTQAGAATIAHRRAALGKVGIKTALTITSDRIAERETEMTAAKAIRIVCIHKTHLRRTPKSNKDRQRESGRIIADTTPSSIGLNVLPETRIKVARA